MKVVSVKLIKSTNNNFNKKVMRNLGFKVVLAGRPAGCQWQCLCSLPPESHYGGAGAGSCLCPKSLPL